MAQELQGKTAIIYGAGGGLGGGIARKFASEGARVLVVGRTQEKLDRVVSDITDAGGQAEAAAFDALDERAVDEHVRQAGSVDISFNLITRGDVQRIPLVEMTTDDLLRAVLGGAAAFAVFFGSGRFASAIREPSGSRPPAHAPVR